MSTKKTPLTLPPLSGLDLVANAWSDDEIDCYGILGNPRQYRIGPYIAHLFDMRLRRWYSISADHYEPDPADPEWDELQDPYWRDVLRQTGHRGQDEFNHIQVDPVDGSLSFSLLPDVRCCHTLHLHKPPDGPSPDHPHVLFTALKNRQYLEYSVETCMWNGRRCVFKQPLMGGQVDLIDAEIAMMNRLRHSPHIVQSIAYVVDEDGDLRGILLPWAGVTIDALPIVRWSYFRDVIYGLRDIHSLPVPGSDKGEASHGDVFCRNILVQDGVARLIDVNNEGLNYPGDHKAFANVVQSLMHKGDEDIDKERLSELEDLLRAGMAFAQVAEKMKDW